RGLRPGAYGGGSSRLPRGLRDDAGAAARPGRRCLAQHAAAAVRGLGHVGDEGGAERRAQLLDPRRLVGRGGVSSLRIRAWSCGCTSRRTRAHRAPPAASPSEARNALWSRRRTASSLGSKRMSDEGAPDFEQLVRDALDELPNDIRSLMTNVAITVEDMSPRGPNLLGLYEGVPWGKRGPYYSGALPDKITIYRVPLGRVSV